VIIVDKKKDKKKNELGENSGAINKPKKVITVIGRSGNKFVKKDILVKNE
jgi:hypothetical protein